MLFTYLKIYFLKEDRDRILGIRDLAVSIKNINVFIYNGYGVNDWPSVHSIVGGDLS